MNKEKLVFELFKDQIKREYMKVLKVGVSIFNSSKTNINTRIREYCKKIGANYVEVQTLINNYKTEIRLGEDGKKIEHVDESKKLSIHKKVKRDQMNRANAASKKIIDRNEVGHERISG